MKPVTFLVMSVGPFEKNGTCQYLGRIGGRQNTVVCLPKEFDKHVPSYEKAGFRVFVYDQSKYIDEGFEFFGFKPRNCGGVGRQGIAEAVDALDDGNMLFCQFDDDTSNLLVRIRTNERQCTWRATTILHIESLIEIVNMLHEFYEETGIKVQAKTGATISESSNRVLANRKIFNNFIMYKSDRWRGEGFKSLCSDDVRYNFYKSMCDAQVLASTHYLSINFTQNQGDRNDGNAPLYNKDCSWKKSFSLRMINPAFSTQYVSREPNRILFRETLQYSALYPPVLLSDEEGNVTSQLVFY